jgi:hypothetical protein
LLALHDGREESCSELKTILVVEELIAEIPISSGGLRGNDGNSLGELRDGKGFVKVENSLSLQSLDNLLTLTSHIAKGIVRVYVLNYPGETVSLVKLSLYQE